MLPSPNPETTLELKISKEHKERLEKAAAITGLSLNNYVIHQALNAAIEHIESYGKMVLSERDSEIFLAALENPPLPNEALKAAIKEHCEEYGKL
ncbi:MAG: DUF1778 domain-containing protein [Scytonematopsis contorta HA4267-MV1]|jgi:uncharacterized protein (DUF1778 family)|nr:DUF1778 domain-containing protein [Scytonematopsis contorta HA4267-MV1]